MKIIGIIPARYQSTRFPGKPLVLINGKTMIQRVYEQCLKTNILSKVVVATDDSRIFEHIKAFGGNVVLTSPDHCSGTDRCNEVISKLKAHNELFDIAINIQGDEPYINPIQIEELVACFNDSETQIATLIKKIENAEDLFSPNCVKAIADSSNRAIYFSRNPIPYVRNAEQKDWLAHRTFYKHIGIYGYKTSVLEEITKLEVSSLEKAESLEQLRWIENKYIIKTSITTFESIAIDTPSDIEKIII
ncbi:MAG: 3-deoxy-manno-octulosonate cytidylyltransferase [Bacteroidota bacterium]